MMSLRRNIIAGWCPSLGPTAGTLLDRSPRRNHGTLTNMDPSTDWVVNGGKWALDFDGINDRVLATVTPATLPALTLSCWVKTSAATRSGILTIALNPTGCYIDLLSTGVLRCAIESNANSYIFRDSTAAVSGQGWKFVAMTAITSSLSVYVDGANVTTGGGTSGTVSQLFGGSLQIGNGFASPYGGFLAGLVDDVQVRDARLSDTEMMQLYQLGRGGIYQQERRTRYASVRRFRRRQYAQLVGGGIV